MLTHMKRWHILRPLRPVVHFYRRLTQALIRRVRYVWMQKLFGRPPIPPPPEHKVSVILDYARRFRTPVLIETGTYLGDTVEAVRDTFKRVWSIEIDDQLFEDAVRRFAAYEHVTILHGDSAQMLPAVLAKETGPVAFWLDGHWSGGITARGETDTPIVAELRTILARVGPDDVILIDDARDFGTGDYPTIRVVEAMIGEARPRWHFEVKTDIMRAHRRS